MQRRLLLVLASALAIGFAAAAPASAATNDRLAQRVSYADLNLDNRAGAEVMISRIERAVGRVCGRRNGTIPLSFRVRIERCMEEETADALADLGHSGVSALYYRRAPEVVIAAR
jgi:UrcA family protein